MSVEKYGDSNEPSAIVVRRNAKAEDIEFFTHQSYSQQLGLMTRPQGHVVPAHVHNLVERTIFQTQEVLIIRKGKCLVELIDKNVIWERIVLEEGDTILLAHGGHRIEMLTECEILEVKQGPYAGDNDKSRITVK